MKTSRFAYWIISTLAVLFLFIGFSVRSFKTNAELDFKIKSSDHFKNPLCDNLDINRNISVNKDNMNSDEVINALMTILFNRYKEQNDSSIRIDDYVINNIDMVLDNGKGSVFGVLYSVKGAETRTRWDSNTQLDKWTPTEKIYCSYYEQDNKYELNIIGENPLYYKGNENKLNTEDIVKKLFDKEYLFPRTFDSNEGSRLLSYNIDKIETLKSSDNTKEMFSIEYSIQGIKEKCFWTFADEDGKGSGIMDRKLVSIGNFYEIQGSD